MPRILEFTVPPERTKELIEQVDTVEGLIGCRVQYGISTKPPGDVVVVTTTNRSMHPLMRTLEERGLLRGSGWSIAFSEPTGLIAPTAQSDIEKDITEITWEEMDFTLLRESNMTSNSLLVMVASGVMAALGIGMGALHLVIAAMVIAPGFEPIIRISLDVVSGSGEWQRGISDTLSAYAALLGGALLAALALLAAGEPLLAGGSAYLPAESLVRFWTQPTLPTLVVAVFASAAGAVLIASNRSVLTAGVMIALALVPPPAIAALALVAGEADVAARALLRWTVEVGIVAAAGAVVFVWKRLSVQQRTALH